MRSKQFASGALGLALAASAHAGIVLTFFPVSDFNSNTVAMDATLGLTGYTIDNFESTTLIPGLTIDMNGFGVPDTVLTSLPNLYNENGCGTLSQNSAWDGTDAVINIASNAENSCSTPANIAQTITFNYAPGTTSFGIGMGNFQSLSGSQIPITNHELFVNGVDAGLLETLAGSAWTPGFARDAYLVVTGTGGTAITSVGFENLTNADVLIFDHLAVQPAAVPEPAILFSAGFSLLALGAWRRRTARSTGSSRITRPSDSDSTA